MWWPPLQDSFYSVWWSATRACRCCSPWWPLGPDKHSGTPNGMPLPAVEKEEKRQIGRTACSHRSGCELVLKQAVQPQRANPQCTRSAGQIMNDSIVGCYGDLTLNKLQFFFSVESSCLARRRWPEAHHCKAPVSLGFHLRTSRLWGKQKKESPLNFRQSGKDCIMLIWLPAGAFGSDLAPL